MKANDADLVHHFGELAANTEYAQLPGDAVEAAKKSILDTLGVSLAGSGWHRRSTKSSATYATRWPSGVVRHRLRPDGAG